MKNKLTKYLILDTVHIFLFVILYDRGSTGMSIHEIAGLTMLSLCVVHVVIHPKYVVNTTRKAFSRGSGLSKKARFSYMLSFLMALAFILMIVSSISISQVVFNNRGTIFMKHLHRMLAALLLLMVGIHLGLHYKMIARKLKMNKIVSIIMIASALIFGIYSLSTGKYISYLTSAVSSAEEHASFQGGRGQGNGNAQGSGQRYSRGIDFAKTGITVLSYGSIIYVFCFATYAIESGFKKKTKQILT
ncbi:MAG: DUF4405 domain-containing protein [Sphaerochaetaceae bacterium]|nr:DUF4405 domain-containing protein [Sphaerochaetaceae bacterium]